MTMRMLEIRRILKPMGSVYLHCDHEANAYLRQMMDAVFKPANFRNEIVWHYQTSSGGPRSHFIRNTDTILFYSKSENNVFNILREPWPQSTLRKLQSDERGIYRTNNGKRYYIDPNGKMADNVWEITLSSRSTERTGYPTQKPQALARRIIEASTNPGELVLDCFAGCAYVPVAAEQTGRRWIACDMSPRAWTVVRRQFHKQPDLQIVTEGQIEGAVAHGEQPYTSGKASTSGLATNASFACAGRKNCPNERHLTPHKSGHSCLTFHHRSSANAL